MEISTDISIWISALWFFLIYSFLIKDSPLFKFAESTSVGVAAGVAAAVAFNRILTLGWLPMIEGGLITNIIPLLIGPLIFAQMSRKYRHISRIPLAFMLATGIGVTVMRNIETSIMTQVQGLLIVPTDPLGWFNAIIVLVGCVCTLLVFTYTKEHTGLLGWATKIGTWTIMIALGTSVGTGITMRTTYLLGRLQLIFFDLLGLR
jgi:hypothetical protein